MNCTIHTEKEATGACVYCGKFFCDDCLVEVNGKNYCRDCVSKAFNEKDSEKINIINNNNASAAASASVRTGTVYKKRPWYIRWFWIFMLGMFTGGIYWIVGIILRISWNGKYR